MESVEKRLALTFIIFAFTSFAFCQSVSFDKKIRLNLWAEADAFPGLIESERLQTGRENPREPFLKVQKSALSNNIEGGTDGNTSSNDNTNKNADLQNAREDDIKIVKDALENDSPPFSYAANQLKKLCPYLLNGMVNGWHFTYTPSDKARGVKEYFSVQEIRPRGGNVISYDETQTKPRIVYENSWYENNKVHVWVSYERSEQEIIYYNQWKDIKNPRIMGVGRARLSLGFEGIQKAAEEALKDAIRNHFTKTLRNKPKEITGNVLIYQVPALCIDSGMYKIQLDFFLETSKIVEYNKF